MAKETIEDDLSIFYILWLWTSQMVLHKIENKLQQVQSYRSPKLIEHKVQKAQSSMSRKLNEAKLQCWGKTSRRQDLNETKPQWGKTSVRQNLSEAKPQWGKTPMRQNLNEAKPQLSWKLNECKDQWVQISMRIKLLKLTLLLWNIQCHFSHLHHHHRLHHLQTNHWPMHWFLFGNCTTRVSIWTWRCYNWNGERIAALLSTMHFSFLYAKIAAFKPFFFLLKKKTFYDLFFTTAQFKAWFLYLHFQDLKIAMHIAMHISQ